MSERNKHFQTPWSHAIWTWSMCDKKCRNPYISSCGHQLGIASCVVMILHRFPSLRNSASFWINNILAWSAMVKHQHLKHRFTIAQAIVPAERIPYARWLKIHYTDHSDFTPLTWGLFAWKWPLSRFILFWSHLWCKTHKGSRWPFLGCLTRLDPFPLQVGLLDWT